MYKRIIAVAAALGMLYGSTLLPAADSGGEPVSLKESQKTNSLSETLSEKPKYKTQKTKYVSTKELTYGPIRPVEVKNDCGRSEENVERAESGVEGADNGDSAGGADLEVDTAPEPSGELLEEPAGFDRDPEQEAGEDSGEDVDPASYQQVTESNEITDLQPNLQPVASCQQVTEPESEWTYYGNCRITHYCPAECCCGPWAWGATASGEMPIAGWTVANGDLPFGTHVLINGQEYCVTDRGVGGDQFDIFVDTHEEALAKGMYYTDVYVRW